MLIVSHEQCRNLTAANSSNTTGKLAPPAIIRYAELPMGETARQILILESSPTYSKAFQGKAVALIEMSDGRVFFFRTNSVGLKAGPELSKFLDELARLSQWIPDWKMAADRMCHLLGAQMEFISNNPKDVENWKIQELKSQTATWLAMNHTHMNLAQISLATSEAMEQLSKDISLQIDCFMAKLDLDACTLANHAPVSWQASYNYFRSIEGEYSLYRRQAYKTFPMVIQQILSFPKEKTTDLLIQAVDSGIPLVEYLSKLFSCSKACIRHLNGLQLDEVGLRWNGRLHELLTVLNAVDVNRFPKSTSDWNVFGETLDLLIKMTKLPTTAVSNQLLLKELSQLNWKSNFSESVSYQERAIAIEKFIENIRQSIIVTVWLAKKQNAICNEGLAQRLAAESACALGLSRLEKLSRRWKAEELQLDHMLAPQHIDSFPVFLDEPLILGDMSVIQLTTIKEIDSEGARMENCVASYASSCTNGKSFIFSVRDKMGKSKATVEYQLSRKFTGLPEFELVQQKGFRNSSPSSDCREALNFLFHFTKMPESKQRILSLLVYQRAIQRGGGDIAKKYIRAMDFIKFLEMEVPGRFDFETLASATISNEVRTQ